MSRFENLLLAATRVGGKQKKVTMLKNIKKVTMLLFVAATMMMVSCSKDYENDIVGTWNMKTCTVNAQLVGTSWQFTSGGSFLVSYQGYTGITGTYAIDDDQLTLVIREDGEVESETVTITELSGSDMSWKTREGGKMTFKKK